MGWTILLLAIGLLLIIKGGDVFVDAASWMAEKTGIPRLIIGATVVSLATTLPEMLVSFIAAGGGKVDMAIGNAVGSVTVNIGLIMGIALICIPTAVRRRDYLLKSVLMLGAALILMAFGFTGTIGLVPNVLLLVIFVVAMWDNVHQARLAMKSQLPPAPEAAGQKADDGAIAYIVAKKPAAACGGEAVLGAAVARGKTTGREVAANLAKFVLGAAAIVVGSQLLVDNGSALALLLGVPERIIAVSVVAIGTSLPELVTTLSAIAKKQCSLSVGNIIGANIIDLTLILPISSLIAGKALPVSSQFATVDLPACFAVGCIALIPTLITGKFRRAQGIFMVVFYVAYLVFTTLVLG
ncbi:MAG: calcium/sodium antiporter [Oscillospiraceae bacterium]